MTEKPTSAFEIAERFNFPDGDTVLSGRLSGSEMAVIGPRQAALLKDGKEVGSVTIVGEMIPESRDASRDPALRAISIRGSFPVPLEAGAKYTISL